MLSLSILLRQIKHICQTATDLNKKAPKIKRFLSFFFTWLLAQNHLVYHSIFNENNIHILHLYFWQLWPIKSVPYIYKLLSADGCYRCLKSQQKIKNANFCNKSMKGPALIISDDGVNIKKRKNNWLTAEVIYCNCIRAHGLWTVNTHKKLIKNDLILILLFWFFDVHQRSASQSELIILFEMKLAIF